MRDAPASLTLWAMLKRQPGAMGGRAILDEHGQLWAEFREYAEAEAEGERQAHEKAARRARHRRGGRRGG